MTLYDDGQGDVEPTPRGSAEWYTWAIAHPECAVCGDRAGVTLVDMEPIGSGHFCPEHAEHAAMFLSSLEEPWDV